MDLGLFAGWDRILSVLLKTVVFYCYTVLLLRLAGKRTIARMTVFDFVSTVAMATVVGSTILSSSIALADGVAGLTGLVALQWLVAYISSGSARFYGLVTNSPRLLYDGTRFHDGNLRSERLTREDVMAKIRESGHPNLDSVGAVVLETTGDLAVLDASVPEKPAEPDEAVLRSVRR